jgi:predicted metal-dependent phosphoesterase TrpH
MSFVDLHCHSTASDGSLAPTDVVRLAKQAGVSAMSLTDHDTVAGIREAADEAARQGIDFISGIEISCEFRAPGTMHLLGYGVDPDSPSLARLSAELIGNRNDRNPRIVRRLNELGISVTMKEWEDEAGGQVVGRPHLAAILVRKGYVSSTKHAFDKYIGQGGAAYFDKERVPPKRALDLVFASGGIPVLAHPFQLRCTNDAELETVVKNMVDLGLVGIEVMHSDHDTPLVQRYTRLADRFGLVKTGGSDYHGASKKSIDFGWSHGQRVPREFYDQLLAAHRSRRPLQLAAPE